MLLILILVSSILVFIYLNGLYNERYWKKRGITFHKKNKVMGVFWDFLTTRRAFFENLCDLYKEYPNEPAIGIGSFLTPCLYVRDPVNIQHVLSSDFNSFNHRGVEPNEEDVLAGTILFLNGKKWKLVRQSMTPLFTSTKLKSMYYIIDKSAQDFVTYLKENPKLLKSDTFATLSTFCSAAIGAAVFGLTTNSIFDSPFLKIACSAFEATFVRNIKFAIANLSPSLFKHLNISFFKEYEQFFIGAIKQVVRQRESENVKRHDFADICVSLQSNGKLKDSETGYELEPTDELLAAQAFFFFVAGVEPTAAAIFATLVELGKHPDLQQKLHEEIDKAFEENDGKMTYDIVANLKYLDMVTNEAMRMHPPIGFLSRKCTKDSVLPNGNIKVEKGTKILTAIYELHHDPKYFPDPETFNPERFSKENKNATLDLTYMPFGKGNRICVGMRYAQLQAKAGLVHLLRHFSLKTIVYKERPKYRKDQVQVRLNNVDVELIPRLHTCEKKMLPVLLFICIAVLALIYLNGIHNESYWRKRGVTFYTKNKTLGVFWDFLIKRRALFEYLHDIYKEYPNEPAVGIGSILTPTLYVRDPLNIQHVLTTDFNSFSHRGFEPNQDDLLAGNILFLNGAKWKLVRQRMTPLFTSAKLKSMYYIMDKSAKDFVHYLKDNPTVRKGDAFNTLSTFCSAAICASVFGVTTKSVFDSPFLDVARRSMNPSFKRNIKFALANLSESLFKILNIQIFKEFESFFIAAIKQVIHQRKAENVKKHDFADICVSLQEHGMMKDMDSGLELEPTDELLAAQAFFFLIAGVEPTASAMFATLMEVGKHPEVQNRLQIEIDKAFDKHENDISYDVVTNMEYLDMVMCEAMRLNPAIGFLTRKCVEDTLLPTGNIKVDKGTKIMVPIYELHHDSKYHPDPEVFNPERFSAENKKNILDITYMPFGKGNRNCVGMRYAQMQAKSGLIHLLRNFSSSTNVLAGGVKYRKEQVQVRVTNVDIKLIPRR
ncbi:uncharacterized protein LOC123864575 [Maniola jurtina]|uniref:uncharacterized protein LOC123864575 n=1 Tax=Maniola jurtina TaxID=191418 RepID=UPI001E68DD7A|nr:uncharacterized protein LOC123864575 [Maniola jurtina]